MTPDDEVDTPAVELMAIAEEPVLMGRPAVYANGFTLLSHAYGIQFVFTLKNSQAERPEAVAVVHVSPQLAKMIGRLVRQNILLYEKTMGGPMPLPDSLLDTLNVRELQE
jgi:hypothetical protein